MKESTPSLRPSKISHYVHVGAEAIERSGMIARQADVVAGLTLEVLKGTSRAFDSGKFSVFLVIL